MACPCQQPPALASQTQDLAICYQRAHGVHTVAAGYGRSLLPYRLLCVWLAGASPWMFVREYLHGLSLFLRLCPAWMVVGSDDQGEEG